ncbi:MAG TPA: NAD(P)-dependent oxidoreductase, partial [Ilumatobacteraceae bacterium]
MKLFVTGAGGFVGRAVVDEARSRGHDVVAMVRSTKGVETAGVATVVGDLRQDGPWVAAMAACDAVIHLAASTGDFFDQMASTVLGTERLLAAMSDNGVKRLVHISTFSLYDYRAIPA